MGAGPSSSWASAPGRWSRSRPRSRSRPCRRSTAPTKPGCGPGPRASGTNAVTGERGTRLDFVSFHTKGAAFHPWRTYGPLGLEGAQTPERASPSTPKILAEIRSNLEAIARYPRFRDLPVLVDECDASVPAHWGIYDNANFGYRNTAYYPVFQGQLMKKLLDLDSLGLARVHAATTWSWYFEGDRYFEGTRG